MTGTRIHHNWLHDTQTPIYSSTQVIPRAGMYLDEDSSGFEVDQNVLWNNEFYNIHLDGSLASELTTPFNNYVHNNSIPDVGAIWIHLASRRS